MTAPDATRTGSGAPGAYVAPTGDSGAWRNRIVGSGEEAPDQLVANPRNWRTHPAVRKGATAEWIGKVGEPTVWDIDTGGGYSQKRMGPEDEHTEHSTQKPVECMARPMRNHAGDVYEPFNGSGSTIIAAEMLSRRCYAMEIDPRYVAVAIERWEKFTGRTSERIDG